MKIRSVTYNNRKKSFTVKAGKQTFGFPYLKTDPQPTAKDPVRRVFVDGEIGREGEVHIEQVLEYNEDPSYLRDALLYRLTIEAQKRLEKSQLSKREIIRRLRTSPAQLYRLLDQTNYRKSIDQLLSLLRVLDCEVDFIVRAKTA